MTYNKPTICIALNSNTSLRSLLSSDALRELAEQFNVVYLCADGVTLEQSEGTRIYVASRSSFFVKWADYFMWYLTYFKFFRKTKNFKDRFMSFKIIMLGWKSRIALTMLSLPVIYEITRPIVEHVVIGYNKSLYRSLKNLNPEIVILPGVPFDSFGLEVMKCARRLSIKSIMVVLHWDFFSSKGLLRSEPDIICLWGKQMHEMVINQHQISPQKTKIIGAPQFEIYKQGIKQSDARTYLNLPLDKKIFLFAGTGAPFDEMSILEEIDFFLNERAPQDILILYRPHPKKQPRKNERNFKEYGFKNILLDPENANGNKKAGATSLDYYTNLLFGMDGLISPFSTMVIEAALCGKPCLAIGFSDDLHKWKFEYALNHEHIKPLLAYRWVTLCRKRNQLNDSLDRFLKITAYPDLSAEIQRDIRYIVHADNNSYSKRLYDIVAATGGYP